MFQGPACADDCVDRRNASTTEAEYTAACDAAREAIWLHDLLIELHLKANKSPTLNQDNQRAIFLEKNHSLKQRTKHIEIKLHFIKELVQQGRLSVKYCPTSEMTADILTKPLSAATFEKHRRAITNHPRRDAPVEEECQQDKRIFRQQYRPLN